MNFHNSIRLSPSKDGRHWLVLEYYEYEKNRFIHPGFVTDFASVPRVFWRALPPWGRYSEAALVHDFLYSHPGDFTRSDIDKFFYKRMKSLGVNWFQRWALYLGVKLFGWWSYNKRRNK